MDDLIIETQWDGVDAITNLDETSTSNVCNQSGEATMPPTDGPVLTPFLIMRKVVILLTFLHLNNLLGHLGLEESLACLQIFLIISLRVNINMG